MWAEACNARDALCSICNRINDDEKPACENCWAEKLCNITFNEENN